MKGAPALFFRRKKVNIIDEMLSQAKKEYGMGKAFDDRFVSLSDKFASVVNGKKQEGVPAIMFIQYIDGGKEVVEACDIVEILKMEDSREQVAMMEDLGKQWILDRRKPVLCTYMAFPAMTTGSDDQEFESVLFVGLSFTSARAAIIYRVLREEGLVSIEEVVKVLSENADEHLPSAQETLLSRFYRGYVDGAKGLDAGKTVH